MAMLQLIQLLMVVMMTWEWTVTIIIAQEKVYIFLLLIYIKAKYSFIILLLVQKFLKSYAEYDDLDLDPPPASPEPTLSCETLQCMITNND